MHISPEYQQLFNLASLSGVLVQFYKTTFLFHQQSMLECGFNGFIKSLSVFEHVKPMNLKLASIRFD
jgi:hypothetical protein